MTADRRAALVLAARTAAEKVYGTQFFNEEIEAAIDIIRAEVLEEAALRAEDFLGEAWAGDEIAAAIRALKEKP